MELSTVHSSRHPPCSPGMQLVITLNNKQVRPKIQSERFGEFKNFCPWQEIEQLVHISPLRSHYCFHWVAAEYTLWQNCNALFYNLIASLDFHILEFILIILYNINTCFQKQTNCKHFLLDCWQQ